MIQKSHTVVYYRIFSGLGKTHKNNATRYKTNKEHREKIEATTEGAHDTDKRELQTLKLHESYCSLIRETQDTFTLILYVEKK